MTINKVGETKRMNNISHTLLAQKSGELHSLLGHQQYDHSFGNKSVIFFSTIHVKLTCCHTTCCTPSIQALHLSCETSTILVFLTLTLCRGQSFGIQMESSRAHLSIMYDTITSPEMGETLTVRFSVIESSDKAPGCQTCASSALMISGKKYDDGV